jgi:hypothetical protein
MDEATSEERQGAQLSAGGPQPTSEHALFHRSSACRAIG